LHGVGLVFDVARCAYVDVSVTEMNGISSKQRASVTPVNDAYRHIRMARDSVTSPYARLCGNDGFAVLMAMVNVVNFNHSPKSQL